jgi:hypothetical protein
MRLLLFLGALAVGGLIVTGAIKMTKSNNSITIEIDRQAVRDDARRLVEEGKELIDDAESAMHDRDASQR